MYVLYAWMLVFGFYFKPKIPIYLVFFRFTQQTIYSTLLDAMRLKVPELIRRFEDNFRPKASNFRIKSFYTLDAVAPKSVEFATNISIRNQSVQIFSKASKIVYKLFAGYYIKKYYNIIYTKFQ